MFFFKFIVQIKIIIQTILFKYYLNRKVKNMLKYMPFKICVGIWSLTISRRERDLLKTGDYTRKSSVSYCLWLYTTVLYISRETNFQKCLFGFMSHLFNKFIRLEVVHIIHKLNSIDEIVQYILVYERNPVNFVMLLRSVTECRFIMKFYYL